MARTGTGYERRHPAAQLPLSFAILEIRGQVFPYFLHNSHAFATPRTPPSRVKNASGAIKKAVFGRLGVKRTKDHHAQDPRDRKCLPIKGLPKCVLAELNFVR